MTGAGAKREKSGAVLQFCVYSALDYRMHLDRHTKGDAIHHSIPNSNLERSML
jgi:hypothetical protein